MRGHGQPCRALNLGFDELTTYVRPCLLTTFEPGFFFSELSELRTFTCASFSTVSNPFPTKIFLAADSHATDDDCSPERCRSDPEPCLKLPFGVKRNRRITRTT